MKHRERKRSKVAGYVWMSVAVLIWASWLVLTSLGRTTSLSIIDLAGFRAVIPACVLAPLLWRERRELAKVGLVKCLYLTAYGAPFTVCVGYGLSFAPVAHAGAMVPGMAPLLAAVLSAVFLGQQLGRRQLMSFLLILLACVALVVRPNGFSFSDDTWIGHALFLLGALGWATFTVTMKTLDISPYLATALVGCLSTLFLAPIWIASGWSKHDKQTLPDILFQAGFQGICSGLVSLYAYGQAIRLLGMKASVFTALTPGVATLLAIPVLGQVPNRIDVFALAFIVTGLAFGTFATKATRRGGSEHSQRQQSGGSRQSSKG